MISFLQRHGGSVTGTLSGFDRLRFRGSLRMLTHAGGFASFLRIIGVKLRDFKDHVLASTRKICDSSEEVARAAGRPVQFLRSPQISKEDVAREIAQRDGITDGLICVLSCVEPCVSYDVSKWGQPHLKVITRRCLHHYHYLMHRQFGFMHVRIQTWMPMTMHVYVNGREWLARQMDLAKMPYKRMGNCFTELSDAPAAQLLFQQILHTDWPQMLNEVAQQACPVRQELFAKCPVSYYWSTEASEWATDLMFKTPQLLAELYPSLIRHGIMNMSSRDVLRYLGRKVVDRGKLHARLTSEVNTDLAQRVEGVRIKHRVNTNSIKMYDKQGSVLRVETTINQPGDMKVYRPKEGDEGGKKDWRKLRKGVADLWRLAQVSQSANDRYLSAMAAAQQPVTLQQVSQQLCSSAQWQGGRVRGLNPLSKEDAALLEAVNRGEFLLNGMRNRDLREALFPTKAKNAKETARRRGMITRKLRLLRGHGLIRKIPHSHRYMVSDQGRVAITALLAARAADTEKLTKAA
jgi:hypothetical protein